MSGRSPPRAVMVRPLRKPTVASRFSTRPIVRAFEGARAMAIAPAARAMPIIASAIPARSGLNGCDRPCTWPDRWRVAAMARVIASKAISDAILRMTLPSPEVTRWVRRVGFMCSLSRPVPGLSSVGRGSLFYARCGRRAVRPTALVVRTAPSRSPTMASVTQTRWCRSACTNGDSGIIEDQTRLVVDQAAGEVEDGSGVIVALVGALIGDARVGLFQPFDGEVACAHVRGGGGCSAADRQIHTVHGQGVCHRGGLQVHVNAAVQVRRGLTIDPPVAQPVCLEDD